MARMRRGKRRDPLRAASIDNRLAPALVRRADGQYFAVVELRGDLIAWTWSLEIGPSRSLELSEFGVLSFRSPGFGADVSQAPLPLHCACRRDWI